MGLPSTLSEFPLAIRITHRNTPCFSNVLILNSRKEAVEEASGEEAGRFFGF